MKLASLKHGRDGRLVVVSRDLSRYLPADDVAPTLQAALDDWYTVHPGLEAIAARLTAGEGVSLFEEEDSWYGAQSGLRGIHQIVSRHAKASHVDDQDVRTYRPATQYLASAAGQPYLVPFSLQTGYQ